MLHLLDVWLCIFPAASLLHCCGKALMLWFVGLILTGVCFTDGRCSCMSKNGVIAHYVMESCTGAQYVTPYYNQI